MISRIRILPVLLLLSTLAFGQAPVDIKFKIRNAGVNVTGSFQEVTVTQKFMPDDLQNSYFEVSIQATTINTGIKARDKHLRKAKYFNVEEYPNIKFRSSRITKNPDGYSLKGNLTIKATTLAIEIPFNLEKDDDGNEILKGYVELDRRDYGVGKNHLILGDLVKINIKVPYYPVK